MSTVKNYPENLEDVRTLLSADDAPQTQRKRDAVSAISRVCDMLNRAPADVPASVPELREALLSLHPGQHRITAKTFANIKSQIADGLRSVGVIPDDEHGPERSDSWDAFFGQADASHQAYALARFAKFCAKRGIEPDGVCNAVLADFRAWLNERILSKDPAKICKENCQTWNAIVERRGLPLATLEYERAGCSRSAPLTAYPNSLREDVAAFIDRVTHADLFAEAGPIKPLKPTSVRNVMSHLRQYLDGLVMAGRDEKQFSSLADIATAAHMRDSFKAIRERRSLSEWSPQFGLIAATIIAIAEHHVRVGHDELRAMRLVKKRVTVAPKGMGKRNGERLSQFDDWENVVTVVNLPETWITRAAARPETGRSALTAMRAVAVAILLSCPMRIKNLAGLDLERHVIQRRVGRDTAFTLRIEGCEVKNGEPIEVQLNAWTSRLLRTYIRRYRHLIPTVQSTALFPRVADGLPRTPGNFGQELTTAIFKETGLTIDPHLFRHFAARLYLKERPGDFETVRRMLKYRRLDTTISFYFDISNRWAHTHYDEVVLTKFGGVHA